MSATVNEMMTTHVVAVTKDASCRDIAAMLRRHRISAFPVVDAAGKITLEGRPQTAQQSRNILAEAWHVEGVVSVRDRLTYPEERSSSHV